MEFDNDKNLVEKAKADRKAFALLYQKYSEKIFNYFWYRVSHDKEVAQDLMQDVFLRAFNNLQNFKEESFSYLTYLLRISHNLLVDYYKKPKEISLDNLANDVPEDLPEEIVQHLEDCEKEKAKELWLTIQTLPLHERDVLLLHYRRGFKISEIAKIKGKSENAIKSILFRVRKKLKNKHNLKNLPCFGDKKLDSTRKKFLF